MLFSMDCSTSLSPSISLSTLLSTGFYPGRPARNSQKEVTRPSLLDGSEAEIRKIMFNPVNLFHYIKVVCLAVQSNWFVWLFKAFLLIWGLKPPINK